MTSQILGSWFSPELRSWFHLGLRRFADADTLHEWTLTSNPLSQSPLAIRHSQELFAQIGKVQKSGLNFDQNGRSKVGLLFLMFGSQPGKKSLNHHRLSSNSSRRLNPQTDRV